MKRILSLILCVTAFIMTGCQKVDEQTQLDDRLVGTKWETSDYAYKVIYGGSPYEVYEFVSVAELECYTTNAGKVVKSHGTYTYTLDYPHITINVVTSSGTNPTHYTFKDSRTMVRDDVDEYSPYAKYIKQ
ncbi:MAG: hypothetical protein IJ893_10155 [Bacteroidales bacterium]|nr:hypothetical protein [Bacteroidales bacterium]MBR6863280.1 hypothetical protein [Bacteroidales bacterium]